MSGRGNEDLNFKVSYTVSSRPAWATGDLDSKQPKNRGWGWVPKLKLLMEINSDLDFNESVIAPM